MAAGPPAESGFVLVARSQPAHVGRFDRRQRSRRPSTAPREPVKRAAIVAAPAMGRVPLHWTPPVTNPTAVFFCSLHRTRGLSLRSGLPRRRRPPEVLGSRSRL